jgi:hypothetical protein
MTRLVLLAASFVPMVFGQQESNSLSLTVSRSAFVQPDEALVAISVMASPDVTLTQILTGLQKARLRGENLAGIEALAPANRGGASPFQWLWQFMLPVPLANMKETLLTLVSLQQSPDTANRGLQLSFGVTGVQPSAASLVAQLCPVSEMIADARVQGQKMASAAGQTLGPILAVGNGGVEAVPVPALRAGEFSAFLLGIPAAPGSFARFAAIQPAAACSISVKFRLGS